jgi:hypothetical protein
MKPLFTNKIGRTARLLTGRGSLLPACVLAFLLALLVGFGFGFPSDVLRQRLVQELSVRTGLAVSSDSLELSFPAKLSFDLTIDPHQEQIVPLVFKPLQLQPVWSTLFSAGRAAVLSGRFAGGDIAAQLGADQQLQLDIRGVQLGPLQKPANPYRLDGVLSGTFDARQISRPGSVDALFSAEVGNLQLFGLERAAGARQTFAAGDHQGAAAEPGKGRAGRKLCRAERQRHPAARSKPQADPAESARDHDPGSHLPRIPETADRIERRQAQARRQLSVPHRRNPRRSHPQVTRPVSVPATTRHRRGLRIVSMRSILR